MKTRLLKKTLIMFTFMFGLTQVQAQLFNFSTGTDNWIAGQNVIDFTHNPTGGLSGDGAIQFKRTSDNAQIKLNVAQQTIDATTKKALKLVIKNDSNGTQLRCLIPGQTNINLNVLTPNDTEFKTVYVDLSSWAQWDSTTEEITLYVRQGYPGSGTAGENDIVIDEIEFLDTMPPTTYSEFIQNPSFDGPSGIGHLTGASVDADRNITSAESHDGTQSLRYIYTADATAQYWAFSSYEKIYPSLFAAGSDIQVKMWVKTNRTTPITMQARLKLSNGGVDNAAKPIATVTTTNTVMGWEELTFDIDTTEAFDGVSLWFNIFYADETGGAVAENLNAGDVVYVDQMTGMVTPGTLSVGQNTLEGVSIYPNPVKETLTINSPAGSDIVIYNVLGATVKTVKKANTLQNVSVSDLKSGLYFVKVINQGKVFQNKIIKK